MKNWKAISGKWRKQSVADSQNLLIDIYDIAVILNNALENAIEACRKAESDKQIKLQSYVICNSCKTFLICMES